MIAINGAMTEAVRMKLRAGDEVLYTGVFYTARDQAHKRLCELIARGKKLPFDIKGAIIYYTGPTIAKAGSVIGSAGPTTSSRMDRFTPALLNKGLAAMVGKGSRSSEVAQAIKKSKAVYFATIGGAGAYLSACVKMNKLVAFPELGAEAVRELWVENFPLIVAIDPAGRDIFKMNRRN